MQNTTKPADTGYALLKVKAETKERFDQLRQEQGTPLTTDDELLTRLLDEHDLHQSSNTDQQPA